MAVPLISCRELRCSRPLWRAGASRVLGADADFESGMFYAIAGDPGCGHDLFLHVLGLLEKPDEGRVWLGGTECTALDDAERDELRQANFGFLFPAPALLPSMSVLENIAFPVLKTGPRDEDRQAEQTLRALLFCGLDAEAEIAVGCLPPDRHALAALARAIAHRPRILIAESPPGEAVLAPLARRAVDEFGLTVIWSTGGNGPAQRAADRTLRMSEGRISG